GRRTRRCRARRRIWTTRIARCATTSRMRTASCASDSTASSGRSRRGRMAGIEAEQRLARLRAAIDEVAAEDVAGLIRDARAEAREHLRALLAVAMTDAMV